VEVCRNCKKVIEGADFFRGADYSEPVFCPWCREDARFGPIGRVVNFIRMKAPIVLLVVVLVVIGVGWLAGWIRL
jgi:hypothetical protein